MKLVYTPEGAESQEWEFDPNKLMNVEAEAIERVTGWTFEEFGQHFLKGSVAARHALLWIMLKRKTPPLKYEEVQFSMSEVDVTFSDHEYRAIVDALENKRNTVGLSDEEQHALDELRREVEEESSDVPFGDEPSGETDQS